MAFLNLDCHLCSEQMKAERGCERDSPIPGKWGEIAGQKINRCPKRLITRTTAEFLNAYELIQAGLGLPYGAGTMKHSRKFLDAMRIVHSEIERKRAENVKRRS